MRQKHFLTLLIIDIDDFKKINDCYGHQQGDRILREVADVIQFNVREIDVCARYGGEEFAVVLPYADRRIGGMIAERLRKSISQIKGNFHGTTGITKVTVSIGVAVGPHDILDIHGLIHKADMAMYQAKKDGKNRISYSNVH
ncbi:diguanylate cyclase (GGDEF) domain protein [Desulfobacula toluolica Tol2]|uniref:diguanylate cyclase n=2 Tax=Desulfobacula toluolica TaxID=28223 RepID=K0NMU1_DESTT|nr:diguanylate cyclase (GGDEF) domain protein [Desulfobacula toluolica Tol2]